MRASARRTGRRSGSAGGWSQHESRRGGRRQEAPLPRRPRPDCASCRIRHGDDQRDPVALGDGLARTSTAGHATGNITHRGYVSGVRVPRGDRPSSSRVAVHRRARSRAAPADPRDHPRRLPGRQRRRPIASVARAGDDRISAEYDGGMDRISCGPGRDVVTADARDRVDGDCEVVGRAPPSRPPGERQASTRHRSSRTPSRSGRTTVALLPRTAATARAELQASPSRLRGTEGETGVKGSCPDSQRTSVPPGGRPRASDPTVAYDSVHGVWLANTLAIAPDSTRLTIHRSRDGLVWSGPIDAAGRRRSIPLTTNWLTCDNSPVSLFRGRCYLAYTLVGDQEGEDDVAVRRWERRRPDLVSGGDRFTFR